mmetsp:Transcript_26892/g.65343  ORF Transcript_26892/g.65343 Transcript_26892/m.65343 type:complete len:272 (+) Transcript_26892:298-1113(+)
MVARALRLAPRVLGARGGAPEHQAAEETIADEGEYSKVYEGEGDDVENRAHCAYQGIDDDAHTLVALHQPQGPEGAREPEDLAEGGVCDHICLVHPRKDEDDSVHDVPPTFEVRLVRQQEPLAQHSDEELDGEYEGEDGVHRVNHAVGQHVEAEPRVVVARGGEEEEEARHEDAPQDKAPKGGVLSNRQEKEPHPVPRAEAEENPLSGRHVDSLDVLDLNRLGNSLPERRDAQPRCERQARHRAHVIDCCAHFADGVPRLEVRKRRVLVEL